MSDITKRYKKKALLIAAVQLLVLVGPLLYYLLKAFIASGPATKVTLGMAVTLALVLTLLNALLKMHIRSTIWIIVLAIYYAIENIMPLILM